MSSINDRHIPNMERPAGARNKVLRAKQLVKHNQAVERQKARIERSDRDQIALLNSRLGIDIGAKKERTRLQLRIQASTQKPEHKRSDNKKPKQYPTLDHFTK